MIPDLLDGVYNISISVEDFIGYIVWVNTTQVTVDNTVPVLDDLLPTGSSTDRYPTLEVQTDEETTCKFDEDDLAYENMTTTFDTSDNLSHEYDLGKSDYGNYKYYVKCSDVAGNVGSDEIEFSIKKPIGGGSGGPPLVYNKNLNTTEEVSDIDTTYETPKEDVGKGTTYKPPEATTETIDTPTETSPTGLFLSPLENVSTTTLVMGAVVVLALSSLIFRKEMLEMVDRIRWRHY